VDADKSEWLKITIDGTGFLPPPRRRLPQTTVTQAIAKKLLLLPYLEKNFPMVPQLARDIAAGLKVLPTTAPTENPGWPKVGIAVEYRIRLDMPGFDFEICNAREGARRAAKWHGETDTGVVCTQFIERFPKLLADARHDEQAFARLCLAMAEFEVFVRRHPYDVPFEHESMVQLLTQSNLAAQDVAIVAEAGLRTLGDLAEAVIIDNPVFGNKVIGADGDFIIDSCLMDVKVTLHAAKWSAWKEWLYQLLAYVLLDREDTFGIESIGVLLPRQTHMVRRDLTEFFPGGGDLEAMRIELRQVLADMAREELHWPQDRIEEHLGR